MITRRKVEVYFEHMYCDQCCAEMECNHFLSLSDPPVYTYKCTKCSNTAHSREVYPRPVYEHATDA